MKDHDLAITTAASGAAVVVARFGTAMGRVDKGALDFATDADVEAERAMIAVLAAVRPDDMIVGEESGQIGSGSSGRVWLLDPLCGTLNFAAGMDLVAVNVALSINGRPEVAAVADPFRGRVFWTDGSASFVRAAGQDSPLVPDARARLVELNLDPPFPNAPGFRAATMAGEDLFLAAFRPRVLSTTLALTWVADGRRAAYVTDGDPRDSVHFAAGIAICRAAGCVISDLRGDPLNRPDAGLLVSADETTHRALLALVG